MAVSRATGASGDAQSPVPASGVGLSAAGPSGDTTAPCLFCDRDAHEILGESYSWYIRLDAFPAAPGHVELVTKRHVVSLFDLDGAESAELCGTLSYARELVTARFGAPDGWTVGINEGRAAGRSIDHVHVHLIPRRHGDVPDPRGGIRRGLPNCNPDAWTSAPPVREHTGGNAEDCPVCRPLIDQPGGVLYPWLCTNPEEGSRG